MSSITVLATSIEIDARLLALFIDENLGSVPEDTRPIVHVRDDTGRVFLRASFVSTKLPNGSRTYDLVLT